MPQAPIPDNEASRLKALKDLCLLDTPPEERFDVFTRLAAHVFKAPVAILSLVDTDRVWAKSMVGLDHKGTARDQAFCSWTILHPHEAMVVEDTQKDPRFEDIDSIKADDGIRFYAGIPLLAPNSEYPIGSLCVLDHRPRAFDPVALEALKDLAQGVETALDLQAQLVSAHEHAFQDALTGLGNRRSFNKTIENFVQKARSEQQALGLIAIDLNRFKAVNDTYGHPAGDALLVQVGQRLMAQNDGNLQIVRYGGDEFGILLPPGPLEQVQERAKELSLRIHEALFSPAFLYEGELLPTHGGSVGVAVLLFEDDQTAQTLIAQADGALYAAKKQDFTLAFYSPHLETGIGSKQTMLEDLRQALQKNGEGLELYLQPFCAPLSSDIAGFEALLRWNHPTKGTITANEFIPLAEKSGLALAMDRWVIEEGCRIASMFAHQPISLNLSPLFLEDRQAVAHVKTCLERHEIKSGMVCFEITERHFLDWTADIQQRVLDIQTLGVPFILDDFGAGYASFSILTKMRFEKVKIDQSLGSGLKDGIIDGKSAILLESLIQTLHRLGASVVVEGVERDVQQQILSNIGCDFVQGYAIGRPHPVKYWKD